MFSTKSVLNFHSDVAISFYRNQCVSASQFPRHLDCSVQPHGATREFRPHSHWTQSTTQIMEHIATRDFSDAYILIVFAGHTGHVQREGGDFAADLHEQ